jgi:hypothetical protein
MSNVQINSVTPFLKTQNLCSAGGKLIASTQLINKLTTRVPTNSFVSVDLIESFFVLGLRVELFKLVIRVDLSQLLDSLQHWSIAKKSYQETSL